MVTFTPARVALLAGLAIPLAIATSMVTFAADDAPVYPAEVLEQLATSVAHQAKPSDPAAALALLAAKPTGDPLTAQQLRRSLLALELPLASNVHREVKQLTERDDRIMVWMEHPGLPARATVAIDVAATARWILQQDELHREAQALAQTTQRAGHLAGEYPPSVWALLPKYTSNENLPALTAQLRTRLGSDAGVEAPLASLAVQRDDKQLALELVARGTADRVQQELSALLDAFPQQRRQLLESALQRPELATAALAHLAPLAGESWAREELRTRLSDHRNGTAAALAIARSEDAGLLAEMQQQMFAEGPAASRAALALHLNDSTYARQLLAAYLEEQPDGRFSDQVREWLK